MTVFAIDELDAAVDDFAAVGYAVVRGLYDDASLATLEAELLRLQGELLADALPERCGTVILDDPDAIIDGQAFAHYVCHATEVSDIVASAVRQPALVELARRTLGEAAWLLEDDRFGVVYQDARPGPQSGYSRIGWHSDHQSGPNLDTWPSMAFGTPRHTTASRIPARARIWGIWAMWPNMSGR